MARALQHQTDHKSIMARPHLDPNSILARPCTNYGTALRCTLVAPKSTLDRRCLNPGLTLRDPESTWGRSWSKPASILDQSWVDPASTIRSILDRHWVDPRSTPGRRWVDLCSIMNKHRSILGSGSIQGRSWIDLVDRTPPPKKK